MILQLRSAFTARTHSSSTSTSTSTSTLPQEKSTQEPKPTSSRWRLLVIVPIWVLQLLCFSGYTVLLGLILGISASSPIDGEGEGGKLNPKGDGHAQAWIIINFIATSSALVLTCAECVVYNHGDLHPTFYLWSSITKAVLSTVGIALNASATGSEWAKDTINRILLLFCLGAMVLVWFVGILGLVYAVVMYRRYRRNVQLHLDRWA